MVHTAPASSVPLRPAPATGQRDRMQNSADHRFAGTGAGNRNNRRQPIVHLVAGRSVALRRVATRRRLARIDPESIERRAMRLIGGEANLRAQFPNSRAGK